MPQPEAINRETPTHAEPRQARRAAARRGEDRNDGARRRSRRIRALVTELSAGDATARVRLTVLRRLDQFGSLTPAEIPRAWPLTRAHIRGAIRWLTADNLVATVVQNDSASRFQLTPDGRRVLDEIEWTQTVRELEREGEL